MVLKNINPQLASQLQSNGVTTVDGLVHLGQQLEKDRENQQLYEQRNQLYQGFRGGTTSASIPVKNPVSLQVTPSQPKGPSYFCWRCKGSHPPSLCPQEGSGKQKNKRYTPPSSSLQHSTLNSTPKGPTISTVTHTESTCFSAKPFLTTLLQQLSVPVTIGGWNRNALVDTGSSYTLFNENLWLSLCNRNQELKQWTAGPIYLADGGARKPLGWSEIKITLHTSTITLPVTVLAPEMLAFPAVLGLDYLFFSGLQLDVQNKAYWFHSDEKYYFQKESVHFSEGNAPSAVVLFLVL